ncbi:MAG TPA: sulfatase-like hydrolase/transferase [Candidatus Lokiarchaeia archaeon]|nr:sulfatase-like hydrolase/transferase [Candidatus Lokiarchaeia archaeon]
MSQPNIIFLFSDQQRWDTLGCYGQPLDTTSHLDQMAAEGVRFEYAFTCQPVCGPARACLQTGKYATEVGCHTNGHQLPPGEKTIAHYLSEAGYEVGYIGKWHLASNHNFGSSNYRTKPVPPELRGGYKDFWLASDTLEFTSHAYDGHMFDEDGKRRDFPPGRYRADVLTDWTIQYLHSRNGELPFFLFVSYIEPHHQNDRFHYEGPIGSKERYKDFIVPKDLEGLRGDWKREYPDYLGCINALDANAGRIRAEIESLGLAGNTVIIYTSDHGSHFRTRNSEYKRSCHDGCIRIPLIIFGSDFTGGKVQRELVSLIDLPPTILTLGGVTLPAYMRGRPLQGLVQSTPKHWPEEVFLQISESQCGRAIRTKQWKYSVRAPHARGSDPASDVYAEDFLYDLEADPFEHNNLIRSPEYFEVRKHLAERLKQIMTQIGESNPSIIPKRSRFLDVFQRRK